MGRPLFRDPSIGVGGGGVAMALGVVRASCSAAIANNRGSQWRVACEEARHLLFSSAKWRQHLYQIVMCGIYALRSGIIKLGIHRILSTGQ